MTRRPRRFYSCRAAGRRRIATLALPCVDIPGRVVIQGPTRGVKTKRNKRAISHLLEIPDLLEVVARWDSFVPNQLETGFWYTVIDPVNLRLTSNAPGRPGPYLHQMTVPSSGSHYQ